MALFYTRIFIYLLMINFFVSASFSGTNVIKVAYFHLPPHMIATKDVQKPKGALVEYFEKYIGPAFQKKIQWIGSYDSFIRLNSDAALGVFDITRLITKFSASEELFHFPNSIFMVGEHTLAVKIDDPLTKISSHLDLENHTIVHFSVDKSFYIKVFQNKKMKILTLTGLDWFQRALKMLDFNRVNAVYAPERAPFLYEIKMNKYHKKIKLLPLPEKNNIFFTAFNKKTKGILKYVQQYEEAQSNISMQYTEFLNQYLSAIK